MRNILENKHIRVILSTLYLISILVLIVDYGYTLPRWLDYTFLTFYVLSLVSFIFFNGLNLFYNQARLSRKMVLLDLVSVGWVVFCLFGEFLLTSSSFITSDWVRWATILVLARGANLPKINYKRSVLNPAQLFIVSFIGLVGLGTALLLLPNSTHKGISFVDALFTSTSAVCVTGLAVVDTSSYFTQFGKTIIMLLIQAGGLGILTFASYFSYFFKGGTSYENQIALGDITSSNKLGEVFTTLKRILTITFWVEFIGAFLIFINLSPKLIPNFWERIYFSLFHSISAFCNAGFSTLPNGMMQEGFVANYPLQLTIVLIFVFGGLGFPIIINCMIYLKHFVRRHFLFFVSKKRDYRPWLLTLSNKLNLITVVSLIVGGSVIIFIKEYSNTLAEHHGLGKVVTAIFTATTPRTAGFNSIDFSQLHFSSVIIIILLMWIGASPASTGGGIKTSTFAIATLNFISLAKGKERIEIFRREVADISVRRAFAVMTLSLLVIGFAVFLLAHFDQHLPLLDIAFECFSAYSTTGLSLGITGHLSDPSKIVLVGTMFIGRVSMLSILIAFFKKAKALTYQYPSDEILIN